ncbi:MAG: glycoside hydrolase family 18 protein [Bacteroidetes bacterium]|nr:glycoside hydrolase family 18 protein [Bacteroidota bacterium]
MNQISFLSVILALITLANSANAQTKNNKPAVIAYYAGGPSTIDSFNVKQITHIIFSFGHLKGNRLYISNARDTLTIQNLVAQKTKNPDLKVMLSLGGWGGCKDCSEVFSTKKGRREFATSVKELLDYFNAEGIDLDWEYPAIEGYPGHAYKPEDKQNFTALVKKLRKKLGKDKLISFAAGGFTTFLEQSVEWKKVMKYASFVNLMTYDLTNGYSTITGHHTPLYSSQNQKESGDNAIQYLLSQGIPSNKLVLGAAFYGRVFDSVQNINNGLFQPCKFKSYLPSRYFDSTLTESDGYTYYWDDMAKAPYYYNAATQTFVTVEDKKSIALKTRYAITNKLFGIMFWQLTEDKFQDGLLQSIHNIISGE